MWLLIFAIGWTVGAASACGVWLITTKRLPWEKPESWWPED